MRGEREGRAGGESGRGEREGREESSKESGEERAAAFAQCSRQAFVLADAPAPVDVECALQDALRGEERMAVRRNLAGTKYGLLRPETNLDLDLNLDLERVLLQWLLLLHLPYAELQRLRGDPARPIRLEPLQKDIRRHRRHCERRVSHPLVGSGAVRCTHAAWEDDAAMIERKRVSRRAGGGR